jgi:hypothetical protein
MKINFLWKRENYLEKEMLNFLLPPMLMFDRITEINKILENLKKGL